MSWSIIKCSCSSLFFSQNYGDASDRSQKLLTVAQDQIGRVSRANMAFLARACDVVVCADLRGIATDQFGYYSETGKSTAADQKD